VGHKEEQADLLDWDGAEISVEAIGLHRHVFWEAGS
jgi:hypothetical protein